MMQPLKEEQIELIKRYSESNLKKEVFCLENNIKVHQLDYLIYKQKRIEEAKEPISFVKVETSSTKNNKIEIKLGPCFINVEDDFNEELLSRIIKVIINAKL